MKTVPGNNTVNQNQLTQKLYILREGNGLAKPLQLLICNFCVALLGTILCDGISHPTISWVCPGVSIFIFTYDDHVCDGYIYGKLAISVP
ncbi:MAG: hypothetical protein RMY30_038745 [Nostoc sp. CmiSLP01]